MLRLTALVAAATVLLVLPAPAGAARHRDGLRFTLPQPGTVDVVAAQVTVRSTRPSRRLPRRVRLTIPRRRALPRDARVLTATRLERTRRKATASVFMAVIRKAGDAAPTARAAKVEDPLDVWILALFREEAQTKCTSCKEKFDDGDLHGSGRCDWCEVEHNIATVIHRASNVAQAPLSFFERVRSSENGPIDAFRTSVGGGEPDVDFAHYSGGQAFGWNVRTEADAEKALRDMIGNIWEQRPTAIVPTLETDVGADINGDGVIGPGETIDTTVGPPVITGGEPQPQPAP